MRITGNLSRFLGGFLAVTCFLAIPMLAHGQCERTNEAGLCLSDSIPLAQSVPEKVVPDWGTSSTIAYRVPATTFVPILSNTQYDEHWGAKYHTASGGAAFDAPVHIPSGAKILGMEVAYVDNNPTPSYDVCAWFWDCPETVDTCTYIPPDWYFFCSADYGPPDPGWKTMYYDLSPYNITVNNYTHVYFTRVELYGSDETVKFRSVIVYYRLQISPAPAAATFTDVPTTHPFFRFVEALAAAGITGGCGGDNFCPDNPVTRGQMAVFLSSALGLHWAD